MTGGSICVAQKVTIGDNVTVGANCTIADTDFHPLNAQHRSQHPQEGNTSPILIEDDVFIGMNCLILKGITIGCGSVVGAGSVVTRDVPPHVVVAGNPARVLKELSLITSLVICIFSFSRLFIPRILDLVLHCIQC